MRRCIGVTGRDHPPDAGREVYCTHGVRLVLLTRITWKVPGPCSPDGSGSHIPPMADPAMSVRRSVCRVQRATENSVATIAAATRAEHEHFRGLECPSVLVWLMDDRCCRVSESRRLVLKLNLTLVDYSAPLPSRSGQLPARGCGFRCGTVDLHRTPTASINPTGTHSTRSLRRLEEVEDRNALARGPRRQAAVHRCGAWTQCGGSAPHVALQVGDQRLL